MPPKRRSPRGTLRTFGSKTRQRLLDTGQQHHFIDRFFEKINRTGTKRTGSHGYVAMTGEEDDGERHVARLERIEKLQTAQSRHTDVTDDTTGFDHGKGVEKRFGVRVGVHRVASPFDQPNQRIP
ncbi:MAG TPA: hypothetical protein PKI22_09435 [Hydrogenophilus thermoluteolus]|nr:hypothetical protein [Hydrogenophilus thermoluteolus]